MQRFTIKAPDNIFVDRIVPGDFLTLQKTDSYAGQGIYAVMTFDGVFIIDHNHLLNNNYRTIISAIIGKVISVRFEP